MLQYLRSVHQLGLIGLGTMGANLARNAVSRGVKVAVFNRTREKTDAFVAEHHSEGEFVHCLSLKDLVKALKKPRPILLMVQAGAAVDSVLEELLPLLDKGDIVIDAGNSRYRDTERRQTLCKEKGITLIGMGVSGGEEGALKGPSMMPGGDKKAVETMLPLLQEMAADDGRGGKCVAYMGPGGAGHFVKTVHNGIEYAAMQLIAEVYDVLKSIGGFSNEQLAETFEAWNTLPELSSFLVEITGAIFRKHEGKGHLLDVIRDKGGQKGTGKWTVEAAMEYGASIPTIMAAVDMRILSSAEDLRTAGKILPHHIDIHDPLPRPLKLRSLCASALELSVLLAYRQGFHILERASAAEAWDLDLSETARIWRGGCIIRSGMLGMFQGMFSKKPEAHRDAIIARFSGERQVDLRRIVSIAALRGVPLPALSTSLAYLDALHREWLPQNLVVAQRDFFGAHGFERSDKNGNFHGDW